MNMIEAYDLSKTYRTRVRGEGLAASARAMFRPVYREVLAVQSIDLVVPPGEIVAFIGPNGAGKSTTIKMMTGILRPNSGSIRVLGLDPVRERSNLSYHIGTVFGQKSQLWFHLPPTDSFTLLGRIYDVAPGVLKKRIAMLTERFELGALLDVPVRKMSLGQRIRCEVAASLLHEPEILFLDEPTIGLDVVVKQAIRELIRDLNQEKGTTIFLTSHDAGDVEHVCRRAIVIDHGRIVLDQPVKKLKYDYLNRKIIAVRSTEKHALKPLPGIEVQKTGGLVSRLLVDTRIRPIGEVMSWLVGSGAVADITVEDPPMEEIITTIFSSQDEGGA
ncbi:MAG: ATP-binding cassette domain-containing protein [Eubacteriales bacterium]|nr:ATP-binding cassette domain-containing protein [Eubacteriales bacterium]